MASLRLHLLVATPAQMGSNFAQLCADLPVLHECRCLPDELGLLQALGAGLALEALLVSRRW